MFSTLQREHVEALVLQQQGEEQISQLRAFLSTAESAATELSMQLAAAAQREDLRLAEMQGLRTECELARLSSTRAAARADNLQVHCSFPTNAINCS